MLDNKVPHPPVRMNIFGRMRYSGNTDAVDYNDLAEHRLICGLRGGWHM